MTDPNEGGGDVPRSSPGAGAQVTPAALLKPRTVWAVWWTPDDGGEPWLIQAHPSLETARDRASQFKRPGLVVECQLVPVKVVEDKT